MKTLDEAYEIIENINEYAHQAAWDSWTAADEEEDDEAAEEMREDASLEQAEYFRENYWDLDNEDREVVEHWLKQDEAFREQFRDWFGHDEFDDEFDNDFESSEEE